MVADHRLHHLFAEMLKEKKEIKSAPDFITIFKFMEESDFSGLLKRIFGPLTTSGKIIE